MARFTSDYRQAFLRNLWAAKDETASTLPTLLLATLRGKVQSTEEGFLISSVSGAGHSTQFHIPQSISGGLTPQTLAELCNELINLYEDSARYLDDSTDEEAIYTEMLSRLRPVRRVTHDFTLLGRCA